jgi:ankyrin repeat protein
MWFKVADIDAKDKAGLTALHLAIRNGEVCASLWLSLLHAPLLSPPPPPPPPPHRHFVSSCLLAAII